MIWLYWKPIAVVALLMAIFSAGFYTAKKFDQAQEAKTLEQEIASRIAAENKAASIASLYETQKAISRQSIDAILMKVRTSHAKNPVNCIVPSDRMLEINAAADSASTR